jgi:hypothetical protein
MRKLALACLAFVALLGAACGSGGSDSKDNGGASVGANANAGLNGTAASAAASKVCDGREAVNFAATAAANAANSTGKDFAGMAKALRDDAKAAPSEIKADFTVFADAAGAYFEVLASHNGDFMAIAQDADARAKLERLSSQDFKTASDHISEYFAEHCKG